MLTVWARSRSRLSVSRDSKLILIALLSMSAICFGELFEQVVFVPNWLIGDVDANVLHFRKFKHATDPGMFYFPISLVALISHLRLLGRTSSLSSTQRSKVKKSLFFLVVVLVMTAFVIAQIKLPVLDNGEYSGEALRVRLQIWAGCNVFRIALPLLGIVELGALLATLPRSQPEAMKNIAGARS